MLLEGQGAYEGLLMVVLAAAVKKARAGLEYAASGEHQGYPAGTLELGIALDAINMVACDILHFIEVNADES